MKRRLFMLMLLLVSGAIINVAVAWSSARWIESLARFETFNEAITSTGDDAWRMYYGDCLAGTTLFCSPLRDLPPSVPAADASVQEINRYVENRERWEQGESVPRDPPVAVAAAPRWSRAHSPPPATGDRIDWFEDARGWPARALMSAQVVTFVRLKPSAAKSSEQLWSIELQGVKNRFGDSRRLPLRPIWSGVAINTVFYAAILWLLFAGPFVLRRRRRIRRGLCPKCAYDLRGTQSEACPECGAASIKS